MDLVPLAGALVSLIGAVFLLLASIGILRMPDVYNRMQTGTKATTLGSMFFLLGIGIAQPAWLGKLLLLILFIVFTNPISSHALARASHRRGIPLAGGTVGDALADEHAGESPGAAGAPPQPGDADRPEEKGARL
jgi:multicomponent Na+:H+ antiporter subunit G